MSDKRTPHNSFRKQLTTTVTLGILALALITALTSGWITSSSIHNQMVEDGRQVTNSVAEQSVLSLLYGSGENAEDAFQTALGFPGITHVTLLTADGATLLSKGSHKEGLPRPASLGTDAVLIQEDDNEWVFAAAVYSDPQIESDDSAIALAQQQMERRERLGSVIVVKSKANLKQTVAAIITNNIAITTIIAVILLIIINRDFLRLTRPLSELSQVMGRAEQGDTSALAQLQGPREVRNIGRAFNKMMEALAERDAQLRRHNEQLEHEVAQRTQELVYARDMAIQANQNKSDFLSRVSHELRTPLQSILGYSDLILEELPPEMEDLRHDLETIIANANHLLTMINSILDMSKLEAGRIELQLTSINLPPLINGVVETAIPLLQNNQNRLETRLQLEQEHIVADEAKLRQIMLNLLSNAIKFTEAGTITLDVIQRPDLLHIRVGDTGIGMLPDQLEHIFDPFYQVESSITRRFQGTGLGLAITYQFCKLMGGSIQVKSDHQKGSTFDVRIPLPIKDVENGADMARQE